MNILYLYNATQTYTNAVYEHIAAFEKYSAHRSFFLHQDQTTKFDLNLTSFDAVGIHYSIRLPFDQISESTAKALEDFKGLKFLFIQDEYDHTHRAWYWIKKLDIQLVFTVVPEAGVRLIYPQEEFPNTCFVSTLTGYVPDVLSAFPELTPPSQRSLIVGYRGRPLPIRYGTLGQEKVNIGKLFKSYCDNHNILNDIAWDEESRIYGPHWYKFMASCRSMLGSESGSNVFDWDGTLVLRIAQFRENNPQAGDEEIYQKFVREVELDGVMNQISPRVFEAIAAKTVLVLFEGDYSGAIQPGEHFIAVKKDGSNLDDVVRMLKDSHFVDAMAERAYQDVIASGQYSYSAFVQFIDKEINSSIERIGYMLGEKECCSNISLSSDIECFAAMKATPFRAELITSIESIAPPLLSAEKAPSTKSITATPIRANVVPTIPPIAYFLWRKLPLPLRGFLKSRLKRLLRQG